MKAVHIVVRGRVQGVWFRASAQTRAVELKLVGWVRNRADGSLEVHAEGGEKQLDTFIEWCRKGPPAADVSGLDLETVPREEMDSFEIR